MPGHFGCLLEQLPSDTRVRGGTKHAYHVDPDDEANSVRIPRHKPVKDYVAQQVAEAIEKRAGR